MAGYYGTGRRKKSIARVRLVPGTGAITINKRDIEDYFGLDLSLGEIAEMRGVSRQAIKYTLDCTEQALLEYEKKLRLLDKIIKIQELEISENKPLKEEILRILEDG